MNHLSESTSRAGRKHSFAFVPSFSETIQSSLSPLVVVSFAQKTFERLGWNVVFADVDTAVANRCNSFGEVTHCITVKASNYTIEVKGNSVKGMFWDRGKNSKYVHAFLACFNEEVKKVSTEEIRKMDSDLKRAVLWEDYIAPEELPQPVKRATPGLLLPAIGGLLIAVITGIVFGFLVEFYYVVFVFEVLAGIGMGYGLGHFLKNGNYTNMYKAKVVLIVMTGIFFASSLLFQYSLVLPDLAVDSSFWDFLRFRLDQGLHLKSLNLGWFGILITWLLQLAVPYFIGILWTSKIILKYVIEKVPKEVIDFAYFHIVKGKPENAVRKELAAKGWETTEQQDEVFTAYLAVQESLDFDKQMNSTLEKK